MVNALCCDVIKVSSCNLNANLLLPNTVEHTQTLFRTGFTKDSQSQGLIKTHILKSILGKEGEQIPVV